MLYDFKKHKRPSLLKLIRKLIKNEYKAAFYHLFLCESVFDCHVSTFLTKEK